MAQFNVTVLPPREGIKLKVTQTADAVVGANEINLRVSDDLLGSRIQEVFGAFDKLAQGVRDRNLLDPPNPFNGADLYTWYNIERLTTNGRQTNSTGEQAGSQAVQLAMGANVTATGQLLYLDTAIEVLKAAYLEAVKKVAA